MRCYPRYALRLWCPDLLGWHRCCGASENGQQGGIENQARTEGVGLAAAWLIFHGFYIGNCHMSSGKYVKICSYPDPNLFWVCKLGSVCSNAFMVLSMVKVDIHIFNSLMIMEGMGPKWFTMNKWMVSDPKTYPKILNFSCYVPSRWCRFV